MKGGELREEGRVLHLWMGGGGSNKGRKEDQGSQGWHVHCTTVVYIEGGVTMKERVGGGVHYKKREGLRMFMMA